MPFAISVIWPHPGQELRALVHEVSRLQTYQCGTILLSELKNTPLAVEQFVCQLKTVMQGLFTQLIRICTVVIIL